jgi:superfamily I DNA and/or RNA helicase
LAEGQITRIGEREWAELRERLAPVSERYLRDLLRASGLPLDPLIEGVRQDSLSELERTLTALAAEYAAALERGDRERAGRCRRLVLSSKEHTRLALRHPKLSDEKKAEKQEILMWLTVWLENPRIFQEWAALRKRRIGATGLTVVWPDPSALPPE